MANELTVRPNTVLQRPNGKPILMNAKIRKALIENIKNIIDLSVETRFYENQKRRCAKLFTEFVKEKVNQKDMAVLKKWSKAYEVSPTRSITFKCKDRNSFEINLDPVLIPEGFDSYSNYSDHRTVPMELYKEYEILLELKSNISAAKYDKELAYKSLINASKTLDDVRSVWSDVDKYLIDIITQESGIKVDEQVIDIIQKDVELRAKHSKKESQEA